EGRRAEDPLTLREHAHQLGVGVHLDELEHRGAVVVRHPVVRLDLAAAHHVRVESVGTLLIVHPGQGTPRPMDSPPADPGFQRGTSSSVVPSTRSRSIASTEGPLGYLDWYPRLAAVTR